MFCIVYEQNQKEEKNENKNKTGDGKTARDILEQSSTKTLRLPEPISGKTVKGLSRTTVNIV